MIYEKYERIGKCQMCNNIADVTYKKCTLFKINKINLCDNCVIKHKLATRGVL